VKPQPAAHKTGKSVAIVGSGPAGLACAQQLARAGHAVTVFEKNDRIGGLLRYGIPDFKLEKRVIDRRLEQMRAEGVEFRSGVWVGKAGPGRGVPSDARETLAPEKLLAQFDAVVLSGGAELPRDLPVPGRDLDGVHFAMEFLPLQNKRVAGDKGVTDLWAKDKHVVVIGGGDTGSDCIGTSNRHGAASVTNFELFPMPPDVERNPVWPQWPTRLRTSSSHEEGVERDWAIATKAFVGEGGKVKRLQGIRLQWKDGKATELAGSEFEIPRRPGAAGDGLRFAGAVAAGRVWRAEGRARQRPRRHRRRAGLCDLGEEDIRRGRHAPRPVARGLGNPRGPAVRARGGRVPDRLLGVAALAADGRLGPGAA
jgi:glutamate synthase (NADPH/NADH) small chain